MKVFLNRRVHIGPWGGGNRTVKTLCERLENKGHSFTFDLNQDIDVIYCHDPKPDGSTGLLYDHLLYMKHNFNIPIFQRVGDVFHHRGKQTTEYLKKTLAYPDAISFITDWAANYLNMEIDNSRTFVHDLRSPKLFLREERVKKSNNNKIRLITHHWSNNNLKGMMFYNKIDQLLEEDKYKNLEFVYLGRIPDNFKPKNIIILPPQDTEGVIDQLDLSDIYVTASQYETGGNHVVEAISRGLPVLYHSNGGGICSLCKNNGYEYTSIEEFQNVLDLAINDKMSSKKYEKFVDTLEDVCDVYISIMEKLVDAK